MRMNILDAAYRTGQDYGAEELALRLARPSLSDELNPLRKGFKLGLQTAEEMQAVSGDFRILYTMAANLRHFPPVPMPDDYQPEALPCLRSMADVAHEFSRLMQEVTSDLADGKVTDNELSSAEQRWNTLIMKGQNLMQQLAAMNAVERARGGL